MGFVRSTLSLLVSSTFSRVLNLLSFIVFAQLLGADTVGRYFLFLTIMLLVSAASDFGISGAMEKRISEQSNPSQILSSTLFLKCITLVLVIFGTALSSQYINSYVGHDVLLPVCIGIIGREGGRVGLFLLRGEFQIERTALLQGIRSSATAFLGVTVVLAGFGLTALIWAYVGGWYLVIALAIRSKQTAIASMNKNAINSVISYAKYNVISSLGGQLYNWFDVAVLGFFLTPASVGAYEYAWRITTVVLTTTTSISHSILPYISSWATLDELTQIRETTQSAITISLFFSIPAFFGTLLIGEEILRYVFGPDFVIAGAALVILMGEKVCYSMYAIMARVLGGLDRIRATSYATLVTGIVNLLLNLALIPEYRLVGAAIATGLTVGVNTAFHFGLLWREIEFSIDSVSVSQTFVISGAMGLLIAAVRTVTPITTIYHLLAVISGSILFYTIVTYAMPTLRETVWSNLLAWSE